MQSSEVPSENITAAAEVFLKEVRGSADKLTACLPKRVPATAFTIKSKLPFKAAMIRELLLYRTAALADAAVDLYEKNNIIPAVILTRSIVETLALMFNFHERLERFLENEVKDANALDDFFMCCLMGSKNNPDMPKAINVLTLIDRVEKTMPDFRFMYDALSECAHPNWAGTFGAFGRGHGGDHPEATELELGRRTEAFLPGLSALSGSLMSFDYYYNDSGELVRQLNEHFDTDAA